MWRMRRVASLTAAAMSSTMSTATSTQAARGQSNSNSSSSSTALCDNSSDNYNTTAVDSPFLHQLLHPPETVALPDATRTYRTMDVVPPCDVYDPHVPNCTHNVDNDDNNSNNTAADDDASSVCAAFARGELWRCFATASEAEKRDNRPPRWFEQLCRDLYFRRDSSSGNRGETSNERGSRHDTLDEAAALSDPLADATAATATTAVRGDAARPQRAEAQTAVDPYLWLPFDLLDERAYGVGAYTFAATATYTPAQRAALCGGQASRVYVHFANTYAFPQRWQLPTSLGTEPAKLLVDPRSRVPVVYVQLGAELPPALWLPVQPTAAALRRVLGRFAQMAALHRDWHHTAFAARYAEVQRVMRLQRMPHTSDGDVLRMMAYDARNTAYTAAPLREYNTQQEFFLGEFDDPERLLEHLDLCPLLFAIPHLRTPVDVHAEHMTPTITGPGVAVALYRCLYSKALLLVTVQLSAEVKLPPQDPEAFRFLWRDAQVLPRMRIPVFARVLWPSHSNTSSKKSNADDEDDDDERNAQAAAAAACMSGGGLVVPRLNALLARCHRDNNNNNNSNNNNSNNNNSSNNNTDSGIARTEFAADMPVDAVMALVYTVTWARVWHEFAGVRAMRQRVAALEAAVHAMGSNGGGGGEPPLLYPGTRELPNPEYTLQERLGMHVQYLAQLGDPDVSTTIARLLPTASAPVRMGCAKAALIAGDRALFRHIVAAEPAGRMQLYMTKMVRKRKTRDLVDAEPRLLDGQYEFAAPLWTRRGTRLDRNTLEGAIDAARLAR